MSAFNDPDIYRTILDGLQIGVSVLDRQKKIVFWSEGAEQLTGYARIDVLGHSCTDNIFPHCNQATCELCAEQCPVAVALHDARPVESMTFIHNKSGHRTQVHTWTIPLRDKHGSVIGLIQTFEGEFSVTAPNPNDRSMAERGWLDDVTGLPGQAMMQAHLREMLGSFAELHIPFGIIFLEIQDLTRLRARYGQVAARSLLQVLARTLRNTVWPTDFLGRWSEERFLVTMSGCSEEALHALSDRMLRMAASAAIKWWGEELSVAVATGHTSAVGGDTQESILERVQQNLRSRVAMSAAAGIGGDSSSRS